ncbi:MAG: TetR/AcrR family transcriptional regulator [Desertimonas sp.]
MASMTPHDYFEAGQALLAGGGIQAVTIANVCARLGTTKGSFYHHFRNVEDFHDRLLDDWYVEHVARRKAVVDAEPDPLGRLEALRRFGLDRRHDTEAAIRSWARTSPRAAEVQRRIDNNRRTYFADTCQALGIDRARCDAFAELALLITAGSQNLCGPVDRELVERAGGFLCASVLATAEVEGTSSS